MTNKKLLLTFFVLCPLLLPAFPIMCFGCVFTVPSGGDIQAAIDAASANDVICLTLGGTYTPAATINIDKPITLTTSDPYASNKPVINGDNGTRLLDRIIYITSNNVTLNGLEVKNGTGDLIRSDSSGENLLEVNVRNCVVHGATGDEGIQLAECTNCLVECNVMYDIAEDAISFAYATGGTIQNNEIYDSRSENAAIYIYNSGNMTIACNYIHDTTAANGIKLYKNYGSEHLVQNNLIVNNIWTGGTRNYDEADGNTLNIYKPQVNSTYVIEHNTFDNNTGEDRDGNPTGHGIYVNDSNDNDFVTAVTDNIVTNHNGFGIRTYYGAIVNYDYNNLWENDNGTTDGNPIDGGNNISQDPLYNPDYTLQAGSPAKNAASDGKDMGVLFNECIGCEPSLIDLASMEAVPANRKITVKWTTASEVNNAGFNIYRAKVEDGEYEQINDSLIPAEGSPTEGAAYEFIDNDVQIRKTYYYMLEDVDQNGISTLHGPVSATPRLLYGIGQ